MAASVHEIVNSLDSRYQNIRKRYAGEIKLGVIFNAINLAVITVLVTKPDFLITPEFYIAAGLEIMAAGMLGLSFGKQAQENAEALENYKRAMNKVPMKPW